MAPRPDRRTDPTLPTILTAHLPLATFVVLLLVGFAVVRYSVLYGPSVYIVTELAYELFGESIPAAKTGSLPALVACLSLLHLTLRRRMHDGAALVLLGVASLLM